MPQRKDFRISTALEDAHWWYLAVYDLVGRMLQPLRTAGDLLVLDAGCGSGGLVRSLQKSSRTVGVDIDRDALAAGRRAGTEHLAQASVEALPFRDGLFDAVVSVDVLCHELCDDAAALREILRVLKPGGRLLLNLPAYNWLMGPHDKAVGNRRRYARRDVEDLLTVAGFRIEHLAYRNNLLFPIACLRRLAQKALLRSKERYDVTALPGWLNGLLFGVIGLETRLLKWWNLPFGLSVFAVAQRPGSCQE
jgi:SAM-dependent methyltransferase